MAKVNGDTEVNLRNKYVPNGFPEFILFDKNYKQIKFNGSFKNETDLSDWLFKTIQEHSLLNQRNKRQALNENKIVLQLNYSNFDNAIKKYKNQCLFVMFCN